MSNPYEKPKSELLDGFEAEFVCPYCGDRLSEERNYHCGEANHGEWHYLDTIKQELLTPEEYYRLVLKGIP